MANMSRGTCGLVVTVVALFIACIGLLVALIVNSKNIDKSNTSTTVNEIKRDDIGNPIISGSTDDDYYSEIIEGGNPEPEPDDNKDDHAINNTLIFPWEKNPRLPKSVLPIHYDLFLHPDLTEGLFYGKVDIEVNSLEERDYFVVHVKDFMEISARLTKNDQPIDIMETIDYKKNEYFVIRTSETVPKGTYVIHFGKLLDT